MKMMVLSHNAKQNNEEMTMITIKWQWRPLIRGKDAILKQVDLLC